MDKIKILHMAIYFISILGILMGLDMLLGAKITSHLKKVLDRKVLNFDKIVARIAYSFNKIADTSIDIDGKIIRKAKARIILGLLFIAISTVMIFLARKY
jgi:hypothetical protein